jgi:glutamate/tyrosine decarboxylase-like PLP-dependent enzyme
VSDEETLDPRDWEKARALGHRMVDDMFDHLRTQRERPAWRRMPEEAKARFAKPLPREPAQLDEVYAEFLEEIFPYLVGNTHPRFWGWVIGTGTAGGALSDFLASALNTNTGGLDNHSANHVERQVLSWIKEMLGYPASASGLLTSGCSAANLIGLAVARNAMAGFDLRREGLGASPKRMTLYASQESHSSIQKAVELLGLGADSLRLVPANGRFQIDVEALGRAIAADRKNGDAPFCAVGAAGTTSTGAVDDLDALARLCQSEGLWLHVDGAFGAWAALVPDTRRLVAGMERADSLALDLHKWMCMPYDIGCVLVRRESDHRAAFALTPDYLAHGQGGLGLTGGDLPWFSEYGFELSRGFRALRAWMSLKEHGARKYARLIAQNLAQARHLAGLVEAAPELELSAPVVLNVVCFRYVKSGLDGPALDRLNKKIEVELQERGLAVVSTTTVGGRLALHAALCNHRSRREDFDFLIREVIRLGKEFTESQEEPSVGE